MGQKINSNAMRMGINKDWKSKWYKNRSEYVDTLHEDLEIRALISKHLSTAGLDNIEISRSAGSLLINAYVARPGVAIGRGGTGIENLTDDLKRKYGKGTELKISEVKKPDLSATIIASEISSGLLRRMPPKLLALNAIEKAKSSGAKGIRVWVSGRINGAAQARTIKFSDGPVPLHTLKANIDYAKGVAETSDLGKFGIRVWVYQPDDAINLKETS